jgi:ATP-dependent Clp protease adaptor protein ClpS
MSSRTPHDPDRWARRSLPRSAPLTLYNVVLHRDAEKSLLFIVRSVMELTRFCKEEAMTRMWEAYHLGRSVVVATHLERAELFVEQFAERGLQASVEPA